uniref:Uncharacterized protein n=1 Tax=viral metagenome TaxID=1070528 RepID=A0A6C0DRR5_9ZZZZ
MSSKEQLINIIKEWVKNDNEIRLLKKEANKKKDEKKQITEKLMNIMKDNSIDCFDINGGKICYSKKNIKKPITKKYLMDILLKYHNNDLTRATDINNYINDNREEITKEIIERKITKE